MKRLSIIFIMIVGFMLSITLSLADLESQLRSQDLSIAPDTFSDSVQSYYYAVYQDFENYDYVTTGCGHDVVGTPNRSINTVQGTYSYNFTYDPSNSADDDAYCYMRGFDRFNALKYNAFGMWIYIEDLSGMNCSADGGPLQLRLSNGNDGTGAYSAYFKWTCDELIEGWQLLIADNDSITNWGDIFSMMNLTSMRVFIKTNSSHTGLSEIRIDNVYAFHQDKWYNNYVGYEDYRFVDDDSVLLWTNGSDGLTPSLTSTYKKSSYNAINLSWEWDKFATINGSAWTWYYDDYGTIDISKYDMISVWMYINNISTCGSNLYNGINFDGGGIYIRTSATLNSLYMYNCSELTNGWNYLSWDVDDYMWNGTGGPANLSKIIATGIYYYNNNASNDWIVVDDIRAYISDTYYNYSLSGEDNPDAKFYPWYDQYYDNSRGYWGVVNDTNEYGNYTLWLQHVKDFASTNTLFSLLINNSYSNANYTKNYEFITRVKIVNNTFGLTDYCGIASQGATRHTFEIGTSNMRIRDGDGSANLRYYTIASPYGSVRWLRYTVIAGEITWYYKNQSNQDWVELFSHIDGRTQTRMPRLTPDEGNCLYDDMIFRELAQPNVSNYIDMVYTASTPGAVPVQYLVDDIEDFDAITNITNVRDVTFLGLSNDAIEKDASIHWILNGSEDAGFYYGEVRYFSEGYHDLTNVDIFSYWMYLNSTDGLNCSTSQTHRVLLKNETNGNIIWYKNCSELQAGWQRYTINLSNPVSGTGLDNVTGFFFRLDNNNTKNIDVKIDALYAYNSSQFVDYYWTDLTNVYPTLNEDETGYIDIVYYNISHYYSGTLEYINLYDPDVGGNYTGIQKKDWNWNNNYRITFRGVLAEDLGGERCYVSLDNNFTDTDYWYTNSLLWWWFTNIKVKDDDGNDYIVAVPDTTNINLWFQIIKNNSWMEFYYSNDSQDNWNLIANYTVDNFSASELSPLTFIAKDAQCLFNDIVITELPEETYYYSTATYSPSYVHSDMFDGSEDRDRSNVTYEWFKSGSLTYTDVVNDPEDFSQPNYRTLSEGTWTANVTTCYYNPALSCSEETSEAIYITQVISSIINSHYITPYYPEITNNLSCNFDVTETNNLPLNVTVTWYNSTDNNTWIHDTAYDYIYSTVTQNTTITTAVGTGSVPLAAVNDYEYWKCQIDVISELYTLSGNSSEVSIYPLESLTIYSPSNVTYLNEQLNVSYSVLDYDGTAECVLFVNETAGTSHVHLYDDLISYYDFNDNANDIHGSIDGIIVNAIGNQTGKLDDAFIFDGNGDYININGQPHLENQSMFAWIKLPANITDMVSVDYEILDRDGEFAFRIDADGTNKLQVIIWDTVGTPNVRGDKTDWIGNQWYHVGFTTNGTNMCLYVDGVADGTCGVYVGPIDDSGVWYKIGISAAGLTKSFNGTIDEVAIWNRTLTTSEILQLYNSSVGLAYNNFPLMPDYQTVNNGTVSSLNYTLPYDGYYNWNINCTSPTNTYEITSGPYDYYYDTVAVTFNNYADDSTPVSPEVGDTINLDVRVYDRFKVDSCKLQVQPNGTYMNYSTINVNAQGYTNLSFPYVVQPEAAGNGTVVNWSIWCNDTAGNVNISYQQNFTVVDLTAPLISLLGGNFFSTNNRTVISGAAYPNASLNIMFWDYALFQAVVNITCDINGTIYYWEELDFNISQYNLTEGVNLTNLALQRCEVFISASDDHTDKEIKDYKDKMLDDGLQFETDYGITVNIQDKDGSSKIKEVDTNKLIDRYTFQFKFKEKEYSKTFVITSDYKLYDRPNSNIPGHLVAWNDRLKRGNWIDLQDKNPNSDLVYTTTKINDYTYEVTVTSANGFEDLEFQSIGGTNIFNATYAFYLGGAINLSTLNVYDNGTYIEDWTLTIGVINSYPGFNGTFVVNASTEQVVNISNGTYWFNFSHASYYPMSYLVTVENASQNLTYETYQAIVNILVRNIKTGVYLTNGNISIGNFVGGQRDTTYNTTIITTFYINASNYWAYAEVENYDPNNTTTFSILSFQNITITIDMSFIAMFNFYDERTLGVFNISGADVVNFLLYCPNGTYTTIINETNQSIPIGCDYTKFKLVLDYGTTSYYRSFIFPPSDVFNQSIYLIDLLTTQHIYNSLIIDDLLSEYINPSIYVKKLINDEEIIITSDYVDIENKIGAYLIENHEYIIEIHSDNQPVRVMGNYAADIGGDKTIRLYDISLNIESEGPINSISYQVGTQNISGTIYAVAVYNDTDNLTTSVTFTVRSDTYNGPIVYTATVLNSSNVEFLYNISSYINDTSLYATLIYTQPNVGTDSASKYISELQNITLAIFKYVDRDFMNWFITLLLGTLAILATIKTANHVSILMIGTAALFVLFGWYQLAWGVIALAAIISLLYLLKEGDRNMTV